MLKGAFLWKQNKDGDDDNRPDGDDDDHMNNDCFMIVVVGIAATDLH